MTVTITFSVSRLVSELGRSPERKIQYLTLDVMTI
jgi:hypothetical protein